MHDIRSTGEEAERWLEALEANQSRPHAAPVDVEPVGNAFKSTETDSAKDQVHPALLLLILTILLSSLLLLVVYQSGVSRSSSAASSSSLDYSASCGSVSSSTGKWWPVLGPGDRSLLATVRGRFCADAYINAHGALQVASFGSWEEADRFRIRIEQATRQSFRVGQAR
jgi:hypothetical protein